MWITLIIVVIVTCIRIAKITTITWKVVLDMIPFDDCADLFCPGDCIDCPIYDFCPDKKIDFSLFDDGGEYFA